MTLSSNKDFSTVYQRVIEHCRPYRFTGPWARLQADCDIWEPVTAAALQHLEKEFGRSKLIKAKVAFEDRDGLLRSSCDGLGPVGMVCPLRTSTDARPFDLVSQAGCLSGTLPVCTALEDGRIRNSINRTSGALLAVFYPSG